MNPEKLKALIRAAAFADWQKVVLNGGPPCFHLQSRGAFCLRAERWDGHSGNNPDHAFVSLADLLSEFQEGAA